MAREVRLCPNTRRRTAIGVGGGCLFALGPILLVGALIVFGAVAWPPALKGLVLAVSGVAGWVLAIPFFVIALSFLWSFRCLECGRRIHRLRRVPLRQERGHALRYYCPACRIDRDMGWREGTGDCVC